MEEINVKKIRKILIVLLFIWMIVVFLLSHQNGDASSSLSRAIADFFAKGDKAQSDILEPMIRKIAHMVEYAIGGMLCYGITLTYEDWSIKFSVIGSIVFLLLFSISDEYHQLFIDSRNGSVFDVIIDTLGGALGVGAMYIIILSINAIEAKVKNSAE